MLGVSLLPSVWLIACLLIDGGESCKDSYVSTGCMLCFSLSTVFIWDVLFRSHGIGSRSSLKVWRIYCVDCVFGVFHLTTGRVWYWVQGATCWESVVLGPGGHLLGECGTGSRGPPAGRVWYWVQGATCWESVVLGPGGHLLGECGTGSRGPPAGRVVLGPGGHLLGECGTGSRGPPAGRVWYWVQGATCWESVVLGSGGHLLGECGTGSRGPVPHCSTAGGSLLRPCCWPCCRHVWIPNQHCYLSQCSAAPEIAMSWRWEAI